ncbi:hypothetical protein NKK66_RS11900 [Escherichia coli]|uniref:Uncharacterized protein n=1 Tax=Escherichia coli TaxID=562 RepID=A0A0L7AK01_ECOLX|nr:MULTISPECIES: hypothetical protein [Escherichia]EHQ5524852.1 hypothetical protein [Escherichia coli O2]EGO6587334.1 hypothetical protein [Escherichia coli]EGO7493690.1 hypothetical protein [Escherichia coli]EGO7964845.1 hypothetical protein [Escherichia coli]EGO7971850.1 hypothetical protein [Escherichia coli]
MDYPHIDSRISTNEIINCLSKTMQKSGYIMDLNGTKLPINAKEFATYKMSKYTGSFWIEYSTEGRPTRDVGIINATNDSYNILNDTLQFCSNIMAKY